MAWKSTEVAFKRHASSLQTLSALREPTVVGVHFSAPLSPRGRTVSAWDSDPALTHPRHGGGGGRGRGCEILKEGASAPYSVTLSV